MPDSNIVSFFNKNAEDLQTQRTSLKVEIYGVKIEMDVYGKDNTGIKDFLETCLRTASTSSHASAK
ncbi:hypothetical protein [Acinetobacter tjernbergiae]|jgi:hypothetical protein|uniref:Uncharacterized protein n=1 Tax=Acinetobacter tjernbergiae DSM 14971 = CIP 107465 TaxID=1120928 RepID=V2UGZ1_9GAMM|nr:hypothetical protein [Acinetobacter tjernbergiae]ESK54008.1 hypothetical protein F990_03053 [Acinetobacter tjernbergiae DSM 14971 = CIP 107465]